MLRKIIAIKNIGRFRDYAASGDVELKPYTLIFAENGRGKTTLCAILRSLQSGDPAFIIGRTMLGAIAPPAVRLLLDARALQFSEGAWSDAFPDILVFDSTFVSENVFSGDIVGITHRRALYRIIVGSQGVELARRIDQLDADSRAKATEIRERTAAAERHIPHGIALDEFLALSEDPDVDDKIAALERERESVLQLDQIRTRPGLSEATLPTLPDDFETLLSKTIEGVGEDAGRRVAEQIETHKMHTTGETWLSEGLDHVETETCPFCNQSLTDAAELIQAYRDYFSEAYNELHREVASMRDLLASDFGERRIASIERSFDQNTAHAEFWSRYCEMTPPALPESSNPGETIRALRQATLGLMDSKLAAPLERVTLDQAFVAAQAGLVELKREIDSYNDNVAAVNVVISAKKASTEATDLGTVDAALLLLRATKKRHEPAVVSACRDYQSALAEKRAIEEEKTTLKTELDAYTNQVIGRYEQTINQLLDEFNAGFSITRTTHGYPGGVASSNYQILINRTPVELGDSDTPLSQPSFKNTLSAGDRSTLALAFFLAQLEHDPDLSRKVVVFDDPISSQDSFRKAWTVQRILRCGNAATQVIVLSHDPVFLLRIWNLLSSIPGDRKCLKMERIGQEDTTMRVLDIEHATQSEHRANLRILSDFSLAGNGNPRDVIQKIRLVLETYCRNLSGSLSLDADPFGVIVGKIRDAGPSHQLYPIVDKLDALNVYTRPYHHGPGAATEPINDTELHGFVKLTLDITGGC